MTERMVYERETIFVPDLVRNASPFLDGLTFTKCILKGPAFLRAHSHCTLAFIATKAQPHQVVVSVKPGSGILGAIMLTHVTMRDCYWQSLSLIGTEADCTQMIQAFHAETLDAWKERIGFMQKAMN